jgi:uncharacterized membrane protein YbhN (UPF0104 family)
MNKIPAWLKFLLKVAVSGGCLYYVGQKIDWMQTIGLLRQSHVGWLMGAFVLFVASKWVSAIRLQYYFRNIQLQLEHGANLRLYWLGMFYNLFLPGGIGGDAYKVILLHKEFADVPIKKITAAVLLDRISGLAGLGILVALFGGYIFRDTGWGWAAVSAILPAVWLFYVLVKKWFPSFVGSFFSTLWLGLAVQMLQVLCVWAIMQSIGIQHFFAAFQFLFLLSSVVAIFPFTIGGLGAREIVFLWGSQFFGLQQSEAVFISLLFYLITVLASLAGLIWVYRSPINTSKR